MAVFGLGTFTCITPAFTKIPDSTLMIANKLGVESHVVPGLYVLFLYNGTGGSLLKWFRDTLAKAEKEEAEAAGEDVYDRLMRETPASPSRLMVLPHFTTTGPPLLEHRTVGVMAGLTLDTGRGEIIKGLIEGATYYLAEGVEMLESIGIRIDEYRPTGGGAKSEMWLQTATDIMGKPFAKPLVVEAGCFGAAILAGTGIGHYGSAAEAARELVRIERYYAPDRERYAQYRDRMQIYRRLFPAMKDVLRDLHDLPG
jgi:xylulokinase